MLVYPRGYDCDKCKNTGYKHLDPSNPCKKCWQKYAKPFSGPLAYAPTSGDANLQKPLPRARPAGPPRPSFPQQNSFQQRSFSPPQQQNSCRSPMVTYGTPTLPHANSANTVVVRPGDPRIGGRVCWRCGGDGRISFFLIDSETCDVCGGVGRVMT
ncbi:hypothetical protein BDQ17DRAFT_1361216 [Cyathus striatus]|nr:hypothetical protein BDQ17DRAFT_1361216 [Cyathus striatus]